MNKFTIPRTIEEATESLSGIGRLLHAKEWERAAIVASFVEVSDSKVNLRHQSEHATSSMLSPVAFAALGIAGLKSKDTVRRYVERWTAQRPAPRPGEVIDLAGLPEWPGGSTYEAGPAGAVKRIVDQPSTVREALKDPVFVEKLTSDPEVVEALVSNHKVREAGYLAVTDEAEQIKKEIRPPKIVDDGRRPSEGAVGDGIAYMIETEEIDESLNALIGQTQKVSDILRGGGLNILLAEPEVKAEAQEWVANIRQKLAVINATVDVISDVVNAGGVEDPDTAIAKLLG